MDQIINTDKVAFENLKKSQLTPYQHQAKISTEN